MKIVFEADSQEEFDQKRPELIKAVAGQKFQVELRPKGEKLSTEAREPAFKAQGEMLTYWDKRYNSMVSDLKKEIREIIEE